MEARRLLPVLLLFADGCSRSPAVADMAIEMGAAPDFAVAPDLAPPPAPPIEPPTCGDWIEGGHDAAHSGVICATGQPLGHTLADQVFDPFIAAERADSFGEISAHYQVPLVVGDDVYMEWKSGQYTGPQSLATQKWSEKRLHWNGATLDEVWSFATDWKPVPLSPWEPVFQPAVAGDAIYIPAAGGTLWKVDRRDGTRLARINPFGDTIQADTYVAGGVTSDGAGDLFYTAIQVPADFTLTPSSWLVKVPAAGAPSTVAFQTLVPNAPAPDDNCQQTYDPTNTPLPWPPPASGDGGVPPPPSDACGAQRAALNAAPAVGPDGTIFVVSTAHLNSHYGYLVAVRPDLTPRWATSLRGLLHDGCGVLVPSDDNPEHCSLGATMGVDPETNDDPAATVDDSSSSSPVALPDGGVLYGALTIYNESRGHLVKLDATGKFVASYDFGWDSTPAVRAHDGTYSIILKDNHYADDMGPYYITQLSASLVPEWKFASTNTMSCHRDDKGNVVCASDHPHGFEWCVNSIAIDQTGTVYANSEDGDVYAIRPDGTEREHLFLNLALGAAYTPLAVGRTGIVYTLNDGHLTAVGK